MAKFDKLVRLLSAWFANASSILLLLMFLISLTDIVGTKAFNLPVPGSFELIGFFMAMMIPFAMGLTKQLGRHIKVEIFTDRLPASLKKGIDSTVSLILFCFFAVLVWQIVLFGLSIRKVGEYSQTLHIHLDYFIFVIAFALIPACLVSLLDFLQLLKGYKR